MLIYSNFMENKNVTNMLFFNEWWLHEYISLGMIKSQD